MALSENNFPGTMVFPPQNYEPTVSKTALNDIRALARSWDGVFKFRLYINVTTNDEMKDGDRIETVLELEREIASNDPFAGK